MVQIARKTSIVLTVKKYLATLYVYGSREGQTAAIGLLEQRLESELHGNIQLNWKVVEDLQG